MEKSKNIITVNALTKSFKNVSVLKGVDFEVEKKGSVFSLLLITSGKVSIPSREP